MNIGHGESSTAMTMVSEHIEHDTRERILVVAERLFREIEIGRAHV